VVYFSQYVPQDRASVCFNQLKKCQHIEGGNHLAYVIDCKFWDEYCSWVGLAKSNSQNKCQNFREIIFSKIQEKCMVREYWQKFYFKHL